MDNRENILREAGYKNEASWFYKKEKGVHHTAIEHLDGTIRLYACQTYICDDNYVYDTGNLKINEAELIFLLTILNR